MRIKHTEIVIPTEEGTEPFQNCKLERKPYAEILTQIVGNYTDGFVLALNNEWGAGKTTFIRMWRQDLINKGYKTLFFNAWENDFEKDVLVALISELEELRDSKTKEAYNSVLKKAALLSKKVGPGILKAALEKYAGVESEELLSIIEGTTETGFQALELEIKSYTSRKESLKEFRVSLEEFVKKADPEKPVVFFIDELDRCRPNYSVEVLEEIKHLFSVPGIVFVLSIDKEQLGHAVRGVYGSEKIDAEEYLRRFIDLEYKIPQASNQRFIEYLYDFYDFDSFLNHERRKASPDFSNDSATLKTIASVFFSKNNFTLRQLEKIFARIRLVVRSFQEDQYIFPELIIIVAFLYERRRDLYDKIEKRLLNLQEFVNEMDVVFQTVLDDPDSRKIRFLYASMLLRYYNDYIRLVPNNQEILLVTEPGTGKRKLGVKSALEDETGKLASAVIFFNDQFHTSGIELSWVLKRYELTENISF